MYYENVRLRVINKSILDEIEKMKNQLDTFEQS